MGWQRALSHAGLFRAHASGRGLSARHAERPPNASSAFRIQLRVARVNFRESRFWSGWRKQRQKETGERCGGGPRSFLVQS